MTIKIESRSKTRFLSIGNSTYLLIPADVNRELDKLLKKRDYHIHLFVEGDGVSIILQSGDLF